MSFHSIDCSSIFEIQKTAVFLVPRDWFPSPPRKKLLKSFLFVGPELDERNWELGLCWWLSPGKSSNHMVFAWWKVPSTDRHPKWTIAEYLWNCPKLLGKNDFIDLENPGNTFLSIWGLLDIRRPLQGGGRQRSKDIANLGGSLFRKFGSLWGLTVSLSSLFFPILMHSLGDVLHPGPGVPCFGAFAGFVALGGSQSHFFPGVPCFGSFAGFATFGGSPLGAHSLPYSSLS